MLCGGLTGLFKYLDVPLMIDGELCDGGIAIFSINVEMLSFMAGSVFNSGGAAMSVNREIE